MHSAIVRNDYFTFFTVLYGYLARRSNCALVFRTGHEFSFDSALVEH